MKKNSGCGAERIYKDFDRLGAVEESRSLRRNCILVILLNFWKILI